MLVLCRAADTCARACGLSTDNTGKAIKEDALGLPVTHSGDFFDHMAVMKAEAIYSAGSGGQMMISSEQSLPIGDRALVCSQRGTCVIDVKKYMHRLCVCFSFFLVPA